MFDQAILLKLDIYLKLTLQSNDSSEDLGFMITDGFKFQTLK